MTQGGGPEGGQPKCHVSFFLSIFELNFNAKDFFKAMFSVK